MDGTQFSRSAVGGETDDRDEVIRLSSDVTNLSAGDNFDADGIARIW